MAQKKINWKITINSYLAVSFRCEYNLSDFSSLKRLWEEETEKGEKREKGKKNCPGIDFGNKCYVSWK